MIASWWQAHEFELVIDAVVCGLVFAGWLCWVIPTALRERRQKKRDGIL